MGNEIENFHTTAFKLINALAMFSEYLAMKIDEISYYEDNLLKFLFPTVNKKIEW